MKNWKTYRLSDFVKIKPTIKLDKGQLYPFVEMKDLSEGDKFVQSKEKRELKGGARFENHDTLFARITPCLENGKICQVKNLEGGKGFGSTEFIVLRGKRDISDTDFVFYLSRWKEVRSFAEQNMVGTSGRQRVSKDAFDKLELQLPPLPEQKAIAEILSSLDDKIELNNQINKNLEALAQTIFKQWFIDFEFPNENAEPYKSSGGKMVESELGEMPEGWRVDQLGSIYKTTAGGTPSRNKPEYYVNGDVLWLKSKELNNTFIFNSEETVNELGIKNSSAKLLPKYTTLIAMYGATVGQIGILSTEASCNQAICAIIPNDEYPYSFCYLFFLKYRNQLLGKAVGSAQQNISQELIKNTKLIIPESIICQNFHHVIEPVLKQIETNQQENDVLMSLRDSLLPKLMSGELTVNQAEKLTA